jgi:hypothetical protein
VEVPVKAVVLAKVLAKVRISRTLSRSAANFRPRQGIYREGLSCE